MSRRWLGHGAAVAALLVAVVAGCSNGSNTPTSSVGTSAATIPSTSSSQSTGASPSSAGVRTLGVVALSDTDSGNHALNKAIIDEAASKGWQTSPVIDANGKVDQANSAIQALVQKKVTAIVVTVFPSNSLAAGLASAKAAGIPVVTWGGGLADGIASTLDVDPWTSETGRMLSDMGNTGSVLAFTFRAGKPCVDGEAIFDTLLSAQPTVKITKQEVPAPGWIDAADKYTSAWLKSHPSGSEPLAVWGCWDGPSVGAANAIARAKRTDVRVYGQAAESDALAAIKAGSFTASVWYDLLGAGKLIADTVIQVVDAGPSWTPKQIVLQDYSIVDQSGIDAFLAAHPEMAQ